MIRAEGRLVVSRIIERDDMHRGTKVGDQATVVIRGRGEVRVHYDGAQWRAADESIVCGL